ncbi:MAG: glycoside-pentoside-hexuronide (GPH):cation symporter [Hespellia sp.]|nr:glycoside-pentoside-hexuronide (GPH):cation symporter [Hespellia sp.]
MEKKQKTPMSVRLCYGSGAASSNVINTVLGSFLLAYYTDTALIGVAAISTMLLLARFLDAGTDVVMGCLVDRTNTRWGKARPWLFLAALLTPIGIILILNVPMGWSDSGKLIYAYLTYIFLNCIVCTIHGIAYPTLLARMTIDYKDRALTSAICSICNNISGVVIGSVIPVLVSKLGWSKSSVILGILSGVLLLITVFGVKEKIGIDESTEKRNAQKVPMKVALPIVLKNKYFYIMMLIGIFMLILNANAISSMVYYCNEVIGDPMFMTKLMSIGQIPGILILFFMPIVSKKVGKHRFMLFGVLMCLVGFIILGLADGNRTMTLIGTILRSTGISPVIAGAFAYIADIADFGEWKSGIRTEGLISSAQSIGSKIGIGIGSAMTGGILAATGYVGGASKQSAEAIMGIKFTFGWLGAILSIFLLVCIILLDVEKYMPEVKVHLERKYADNH